MFRNVFEGAWFERILARFDSKRGNDGEERALKASIVWLDVWTGMLGTCFKKWRTQ